MSKNEAIVLPYCMCLSIYIYLVFLYLTMLLYPVTTSFHSFFPQNQVMHSLYYQSNKPAPHRDFSLLPTPCLNILHPESQSISQYLLLHKKTRQILIIHCCTSRSDSSNMPNDDKNGLKSSLSPLSRAATFFSNLCSNLLSPPLDPWVDPKHVLTGNFAPVGEKPPTRCDVVKGKLPSNLNGVYMRNGPNPLYAPIGPYHLFEGDGMVHSVRLSHGQASFCSRFIRTYKYNLEKKAGAPFFPNFFSGSYGLLDLFRIAKATNKVILGELDLREGFGLANTSVAVLFNKLFAMVETDLPYEIKFTEDFDIETIGRCDFQGKVFQNMTAHPKTDPDTGEVFAFRCFPIYPYITFFRFDANGLKEQHEVPMYSIKTPSYIHDFLITKRYAIFSDTQLQMSPTTVISCKGMPAYVDAKKVPRIGILPRYATSDMNIKWLDVPGFNAFHLVNAWDEEEEGDADTIVVVAANCLHIEHFFTDMGKLHLSIEKLRINMKTGDTSRTVISARNLELGSINSLYIGKKNRYAYMAVGAQVPEMKGVVKLDLERECEVGCRIYERGYYGSEVCFVPNERSNEEDDGYVVSFVYDEAKGEAHLLVMDAKSPELEIVADVKLPERVPFGFHGLFVSDKDLQNMV